MNASEPREDAVAVLPTKWRAAALRLEETAAGESPITWSMLRARAETYRARADELDAALAQQGTVAVAWVQFEDGKPVALSFTHNEAAGCVTPLYAGAPR